MTPTLNRTPSQTSTSTLMPTWSPTATPVSDNFWVCRNLFNVTVNGTVCITISVAETGNTALKIYNSAGEHIKTLYDANSNQPVPSTTFNWDGTNKFGDKVASGVYVIYFSTPIKIRVARLVVLH
jgi:flagellar hook assembly protein FlgD